MSERMGPPHQDNKPKTSESADASFKRSPNAWGRNQRSARESSVIKKEQQLKQNQIDPVKTVDPETEMLEIDTSSNSQSELNT